MFIKIDDSIIKLINEEEPTEELKICLDEIFRARRLGQHLIYCKREHLTVIEKINGLSQSTKTAINKIKRNQIYKKSAFDEMSIYMKIISGEKILRKTKEGEKEVIEISIDQLINGSYLESTALLAENLTDCIFFGNITKISNRSNHILKNLSHSTKYIGGGGSQTPRQYTEQKEIKNLTICIVDGDIEYKNGPLGRNTATPLEESEKNNSKPHCASLILDCYSIENLIPASAIASSNQINIEKNIYLQKIKKYQNEDFWPYIALKKGKSCGEIVEQTPKGIYWASHKKSFIEHNPQCLVVSDGNCIGSCCLLEEMPKDTASKVSIHFSENIKNGKIIEITKEINPLPKKIEILWEKIVKKINSWACCGDRITSS